VMGAPNISGRVGGSPPGLGAFLKRESLRSSLEGDLLNQNELIISKKRKGTKTKRGLEIPQR